jgi:hypothetical protein
MLINQVLYLHTQAQRLAGGSTNGY